MKLLLQKIKKLYTQTDMYPKTLLSLFEKHNEDALKLVGNGCSIVTYKKYDLAYRRVKTFLLQKCGKEDIYLDNLNLQFINDELYLRTECKLGINMASKMIQLLKKIVIQAKKLGIIGFDPFFQHQTKWEKVNVEYLTKQEIEKIIKKGITIKRLDVVRDIFLFSIFTGLSYINIKNLTVDHIELRYNDSFWISTKRQKTNTNVELPLLDVPLKIMDKYKNERKGVELLPVMSNQKLNAYLKELADICGIKKRLTHHVARHSFSVSIMLDNGASMEALSKVLGHKNIKTTQLYGKVTNMKVHKEMTTLSKKLKFSY